MLSRLPGSGVVDADRLVTSGVTVSRRKTGRFSNLHVQANSAGVRRVSLGVFPDSASTGVVGAGGTGIGLGASEVSGQRGGALQGTAAAGVSIHGGAMDVVRMGLLGVLWKITLPFTQSISRMFWVSQQCPGMIVQLESKGVM